MQTLLEELKQAEQDSHALGHSRAERGEAEVKRLTALMNAAQSLLDSANEAFGILKHVPGLAAVNAAERLHQAIAKAEPK